MASVAAPAIAWADDDPESSASASARQAGPRAAATADTAKRATAPASVAEAARPVGGPQRTVAANDRSARDRIGSGAARNQLWVSDRVQVLGAVESAAAAVPPAAARPAATQTNSRGPLSAQAQSAAPAAPALQDSANTPARRIPASPTAAPAPQVIQDAVLLGARQLLNGLGNFAVNLPAGDAASFLEGGLLMLRRSLFNEAPRVTPSPQWTSDDGEIQGRIGAFDLEGDTLSYTVTGAPQHGSVEVDESGKYSYTPGSAYQGADSFTVRVAPAERSLHIFDLAGDGSREVTIKIGAPTTYDTPDIAVNLSDTAGHITVKQGLFGFIGTVTLTNLTDDTSGVWLDTTGGFGGITVKELAANYPSFKAKAAESGATVDLHLAYLDTDETRKALVLNNVEITADVAGNYVLTGWVAPDPDIESTEVDAWDVTGKAFKAYFDAFRNTYDLDPGQLLSFKAVELDFTGADLYLDTITPLSYSQAGLYAQDSETRTAATPPTSPTSTAQTSSLATAAPYASLLAAQATASSVNVALSLGQSVYIGRQNGTVEVWTVGSSEKQVLAGLTESGQPPWGWVDAANGKAVEVTTLTRYDRVLKDKAGQDLASSFTGYIRGDELTVTGLGVGSTVTVGSVISAPGVAEGTIITQFVPKTVSQANCSSADGCSVGAAAGGVEGLTGTYKVSKAQTVGDSVALPEFPAGAVFSQTTLSGEVIAATAPAVLVGLSNGSIQMYSPSVSSAGVGTGGWTELHGFQSGWGAVTSVLPYLDGFVVGLDNGYVRQWIGPTTNVATGSDANAPSTWKNNWTVLYQPGSTQAPRYDGTPLPDTFSSSAAITTMMAFRDRPDVCGGPSGKGACDGFLLGRADGSILKFNEGAGGLGQPGWETLVDGSEKTGSGGTSPVVGIVEYGKLVAGNDYLPSFAFALKNVFVGKWEWQGDKYGVTAIRGQDDWGSGNEITAITQLDRGFAVGLATSSVQLRDAASDTWIELHDNGWKSAVTTLIPFRSDAVTGSGKQGLVVGLQNGSLQAWTGAVSGSTGQNNWVELHGTSWQSKVKAIVPAIGSAINLNGDAVTRDGVIVGFENGSVQQWDGDRDWTQLEVAPPNSTETLLGPVPSLADLECDSNWRCTQSGTLQQAVDFGKTLAASGDTWSGSTSQFGTMAGVGSVDDPIFGKDFMAPYPDGGTTYTLAFRKEFSPDALNYTVGGSAPIDFNGSVSLSTNCTGGKTQCAILTVTSVTTANKTVADIREGMDLEPGKFYQLAGLKSTSIGAPVANTTDQFYISGFVPSADIGADIDTRLAGMSAQTPPSLRVGVDVNPLGYGYVVVPDGFFPKFKPGQWSLGVLLATEIGPSLRVQAEVTAPEQDFSLASIRSPGPLGFDSFILSAGARLGADASVNGLPEGTNSLSAYAYAVPGMLFTYNTEGAQGEVQVAFNYYLDANASEFKAVTGATANAYLTPYVNLLYGILIPPSIPLVGGWSLFSVSGGFENPITAGLCVDAGSSCPTADSEAGANASLTFGSSGALNFRAGLLDGITSALSYEKRVSLYQLPSYTMVLA